VQNCLNPDVRASPDFER